MMEFPTGNSPDRLPDRDLIPYLKKQNHNIPDLSG